MAIAPSPLSAVVEDIRAMRTRGASPIACAAAKALAAHVAATSGDLAAVRAAARTGAAQLAASRPTAVSLRHGLAPVTTVVAEAKSAAAAREQAPLAAREFVAQVKAGEEAIAKHGALALKPGERILTHCHSSTVVAILAQAQRDGKAPVVFATETRPFRQGLTTTRWLREAGVDATLVVDSAALHVLRSKGIARVLVGADTVARDGSLFNKVGTSQVALSAHSQSVPLWCAASWIKFTPQAPESVVVEERSPDEVASKADLAPGVKVYNPVFDRTPPSDITGFVTEQGLVRGPQAVEQALRLLPKEMPS